MATRRIRVAVTAADAAANLTTQGGLVTFAPTARRVVDGDVVLPNPIKVRLTAGDTPPVVVLTVDDAATWAWMVVESQMPQGRGSKVTFTISDVAVDATPGSTFDADYGDLTLLDPATLEAAGSATTIGQRLDALESAALIDNGDGTWTVPSA